MKLVLYLLIVASTSCTLVAQLLLKRVIGNGAVRSAMAEGAGQFVLAIMSHPIAWAALSLQVAGYVAWLFVLSKEKMAIAFALSGSFFYLVVSLAGWMFFSEKLTASQWIGITLISAGVLLVATGNK